MQSAHFSMRIDPGTLERLEEQSKQQSVSKSALAQRLIEEGLRMEEHPGIFFQKGPAGRRAKLLGGPDVWQVAVVIRAVQERHGDVVAEASESMGLHPTLIRNAVRYYAEYPEEIDAWIDRNNREAEIAEAAWRRERKLLEASA